MKRWMFEFRQTFTWGHAFGFLAVSVVFLPGLLRGAGLSYFTLLQYVELLFPLIAALLTVNVFAPETRGMVLERVATTLDGLEGIFGRRFAMLAGYVGTVLFMTAGLTLGYLGRLEQLSTVFVFAFIPSLAFMALTACALICTGSASIAIATLSVVWGAMMMMSGVFTSAPVISYLSPFGYFAGYPSLTVWIGKAIWGMLTLFLLGLSLRKLRYPYRLMLQRDS